MKGGSLPQRYTVKSGLTVHGSRRRPRTVKSWLTVHRQSLHTEGGPSCAVRSAGEETALAASRRRALLGCRVDAPGVGGAGRNPA